jgi:hypothetical protein
MTSAPDRFAHIRAALQWRGRPKRTREHLALGSAAAILGLAAVFVVAPPGPPTAADLLEAYIHENAQTLEVSEAAAITPLARDTFSSTPGIATLAAGGTNEDWAKMVLLFGGWPMSENNITVILRWMRQENYTDSWWNRNNPLNNGWGSGGGGGTGSYANLVIAAEMAAENLHRHPGFQNIVDHFAASAPTDETEYAIWYSPWASGHYADGAHWHYNPVDIVKAPAGAWG